MGHSLAVFLHILALRLAVRWGTSSTFFKPPFALPVIARHAPAETLPELSESSAHSVHFHLYVDSVIAGSILFFSFTSYNFKYCMFMWFIQLSCPWFLVHNTYNMILSLACGFA